MATEAPVKPNVPADEEEKRLRVHLSQFLVDLVKAMTKTANYHPEHPQVHQARGGLHNQLRGLLKDRHELAFLRAPSPADKLELVLEGVLAEPMNLSALMNIGPGARFFPKFYEYFGRQALHSLAIKAGMAVAEFDALMEVLARDAEAAEGDGKTKLDELLFEQKVYHLSTVFAEELVAPERRLDWRIRLALSRLKKDLRLLPLSQEGGKQIVEDVVRPLRRPDLLAALLLNCDVVAVDPALLGGAPLPQQILAVTPAALLAPTLGESTRMVAGLAQAAGGLDRVPAAPRLRHLLVDLANRAYAAGGDAGFEALMGLFRAKLLGPTDLSPALREFGMVQRLVQGLAADQTAALNQLRGSLAQPGGPAAELLGPLVVELLRRGQYPLACEALRLAPGGDGAAARAREVLARPAVMRPLLDKFAAGPKEVRQHLAELLGLIGPPAAEPLIELFGHTQDLGVRRAACDAVARLGPAAIHPLLRRLERPDVPWYTIRNVLMVLGEIGQAAPLDFRAYLRHEQHQVREEAAAALARIPIPEAEPLLLNALGDPHPAVRARAVAGLGARRTKQIRAIHFMVEAIRHKGIKETEEDEAVQLQVCAAFQQLGNIRYGGEGQIETVLAQALGGPEGKRGLLGVFGAGGGRSKSPAVRAAIIETLGAIGTAASAGVLERIAEAEGGPNGPRAREALKKLQARPA